MWSWRSIQKISSSWTKIGRIFKAEKTIYTKRIEDTVVSDGAAIPNGVALNTWLSFFTLAPAGWDNMD